MEDLGVLADRSQRVGLKLLVHVSEYNNISRYRYPIFPSATPDAWTLDSFGDIALQ